jgi:hypothetical protein
MKSLLGHFLSEERTRAKKEIKRKCHGEMEKKTRIVEGVKKGKFEGDFLFSLLNF